MFNSLKMSLALALIAPSSDAAVIIPASLPEISAASPLKAAVEAFLQGRRIAAVDMAKPLADGGDPDALFFMAFTMEAKEPAKLSRGLAMDLYYRKAARAGHPEAEMRRKLILLGSTLEKDRHEALQWLETTAAGGDLRATRILGEAWLRGLVDGMLNPARAEQYWKDASERGDGASLILLAKLYEGNFGFPEKMDPESSLGYYRRAAEAGNSEAFVPLGAHLLAGGNEVEGREWLEKAIKKNIQSAWRVLGDHEEKGGDAAEACYRRGAAAGDASCMLKIAEVSADPIESRAWLKNAADVGSLRAAAELGELMVGDKEPDLAEARRYLISSAREGIWQAQHRLGLLYLEGRDLAADPVAGVAWLTEAMKAGDAGVQYELATLHEQGVGCLVNYANAGVLYTLACNKGHAGAATRIAWMAMEGLGTERSLVQAKAHAMLALERGDESAKELLAELDGKLDPTTVVEAGKILADLRAAMKKTPSAGAALMPAGNNGLEDSEK